MDQILFDGKLIPKSEFSFSLDNRAFRYGDALFESILLINGGPANLSLHMERLARGMRLLKMNLPSWMEGKEIEHSLSQVAKSNQLSEGRARMTVFRRGGGLYTPETNEVSYVVEVEPLKPPNGDIGLKVGIYRETRKPIHSLSSLKSANALPYVLAGVYKKDNGHEDCLLLNEKGGIVEAISSNVFFIKGNNLFTPAAGEGCVLGTMRQKILIGASEYFEAVTECEILPEDLAGFDEVYLTNAIQGARWVSSIEGFLFGREKLSVMKTLSSAPLL